MSLNSSKIIFFQILIAEKYVINDYLQMANGKVEVFSKNNVLAFSRNSINPIPDWPFQTSLTLINFNRKSTNVDFRAEFNTTSALVVISTLGDKSSFQPK